VRRRFVEGVVQYDLICGEGRVEAFSQLGEAEIPAVVIEADEAFASS
jgi:ParB family chromosome partitioning protein